MGVRQGECPDRTDETDDLGQQIARRWLACKDHVIVHGRIERRRKKGCRLKSQIKRLKELDDGFREAR